MIGYVNEYVGSSNEENHTFSKKGHFFITLKQALKEKIPQNITLSIVRKHFSKKEMLKQNIQTQSHVKINSTLKNSLMSKLALDFHNKFSFIF